MEKIGKKERRKIVHAALFIHCEEDALRYGVVMHRMWRGRDVERQKIWKLIF